MKTQLPPPSARDFEVYKLVRFQRKTTREAAQLLGISQTRICQIVERVGDFMTEVTPGEDEDPWRAKRLNVAEQVASEQMGCLAQAALGKFYGSEGPQTSVRQIDGQPAVTSVKMGFGQGSYLMLAARLTLLQGKLPVSELGSHVDWENEGESDERGAESGGEGREESREQEKQQTEQMKQTETVQSPPVEGCSKSANQEEVRAQKAEQESIAKSDTPSLYEEVMALMSGPKSGVAPTVQKRGAGPVQAKLEGPSARDKQARKAFLEQDLGEK
jgi:hypothetical protein